MVQESGEAHAYCIMSSISPTILFPRPFLHNDLLKFTQSRDLIFTVTKALQDAGLPYSAIEQAAVGYVYGEKII